MIIPVSPGGGTDAEGRLYAQKLTESLGKQFVLDYKPGAGTTIGANYVAKATPDGHTLLIVSAGFFIAPSFYKTLPYDPEKDVAPISLLTTRPVMLVVHPGLPINTPAEYIAYTRANPGKLNFGTTGIGGSLHLAGLWLDSITNGSVTFVHYKGTGAMLTDLIAGRVQVATQTIPVAVSHSKAGNLPDVHKRMTDDGATMVLSTPVEFGTLIKTEIGRWRRLLQNAGIKPTEE